MVTIRWWIIFTVIPILLGLGVVVGYLSERTLQSVPSAPSSFESPSSLRFIQRDPDDPSDKRDPMMEAGAAFMARVNQYKERLDETPGDLEALIFLGNANYDITRFDKAVEYYERILSIDPANFHIRTDLSTSYYGIGEVDKALEEVRTVLEQNPRHETALYNLGVILLEAKKDEEGAIKSWQKLLAEHPNSLKSQPLREKIRELEVKS